MRILRHLGDDLGPAVVINVLRYLKENCIERFPEQIEVVLLSSLPQNIVERFTVYLHAGKRSHVRGKRAALRGQKRACRVSPDAITGYGGLVVFQPEEHIVLKGKPAFQGETFAALVFAGTAAFGGNLAQNAAHVILDGRCPQGTARQMFAADFKSLLQVLVSLFKRFNGHE